MNVEHDALVSIYNPQERWSYVAQPYYIATDFPWQTGPLNWGDGHDHLICDHELQAIYPAPVFVPHNQCTDPVSGNKSALWNYWYNPGFGGNWECLFALKPYYEATGVLSYGLGATALTGPGIAWKTGPTISVSYDFDFNQDYGFVQLRVLPSSFTPLGVTWYNQPADSGTANPPYKNVNAIAIGFDHPGLTNPRTLDVYTDLNCMGLTFMWRQVSPTFANVTTLGSNYPMAGFEFVPGSPIQVTTTTPHHLASGDTVIITGTLGTDDHGGTVYSAANGEWTVTVLSDTSFSLDESICVDHYQSGGSVFPALGTTELIWGIGTGADEIRYRLLVRDDHDPVLSRQETGQGFSGWTRLRTIPWASDPVGSKGNTGNIAAPLGTWPDLANPRSDTAIVPMAPQKQLEVRLMGGRMQLRLGAGDQSYAFAELRVSEGGDVLNLINLAKIRATFISSGTYSVHPMKFRGDATYISPEIPIGFSSNNYLGSQVHFAGDGVCPADWSVEVDPDRSNLTGPTVQYTLAMKAGVTDANYKGVDYVSVVPVVRAVDLGWGSVVNPAFPRPRTVEPERIVTRSVFDLESLSINWDGELWFNANGDRPLPDGTTGAWGEWSQRTGQRAAEVNLARTTASGGFSPFYRVFTGYAHTSGETLMSPTSGISPGAFVMAGTHFRMGIQDRHIQLMSDEFALPWMDGWNVFFAIAYLAQLGQVDISDMNFASYVPPVPFGPGSDLGTPEGTPAYYLPVGEAGSVITRFTGVAPWTAMQKIAYSIGYMLYWDALSRLSFQKFRVPTAVKRSFFESDVDSFLGQVNGGMEGCSGVQVTKDHSTIRTATVIAGINAFAPTYEPIVVKYEDDQAVTNPFASNYLGYRNRFAWVDSQFADPYFADQAAQKMYDFLRTPTITVDFEANWLQPDLFPCDVIMFQSAKTGTDWLPMLITSITHDATIERATSYISARHIPL